MIPVKGRLFQDTIDGYFPLRDSLRHLLARHGFGAAWVSLAHAPFMDLPGLDWDAPVPLRLGDGAGGLIRSLSVVVVAGSDTVCGAGRWTWFDGRDSAVFDLGWRLAEPVFVQGIGLLPAAEAPVATDTFGALEAGESPVALLRGSVPRPGARLWGVTAQGIRREGTVPLLCGAQAATHPRPAECLAVDTTDPQVAALAERLASDR